MPTNDFFHGKKEWILLFPTPLPLTPYPPHTLGKMDRQKFGEKNGVPSYKKEGNSISFYSARNLVGTGYPMGRRGTGGVTVGREGSVAKPGWADGKEEGRKEGKKENVKVNYHS